MSAAGTMARVYQSLKARVMAGEFLPGERIDPSRLSGELSASATPIRDALHRLAGERLIESWHNEGFRQPIVTETSLRDLYGWSEDILRAVLRAGERRVLPVTLSDQEPASEPAGRTAAAFLRLAEHSTNHEHRAAISSLNDRLHATRSIEASLIAEFDGELLELTSLLERRTWSELRRWSLHYHSVRTRRVADITAAMPRREE